MIQHGGHSVLRAEFQGYEAYISLDLPRCDAQIESYMLGILLAVLMTLHASIDLANVSAYWTYAYASLVFVAIIFAYIKMSGVASGHVLESYIETIDKAAIVIRALLSSVIKKSVLAELMDEDIEMRIRAGVQQFYEELFFCPLKDSTLVISLDFNTRFRLDGTIDK
eukprot:5225954-Amphidinium_carterae.1